MRTSLRCLLTLALPLVALLVAMAVWLSRSAARRGADRRIRLPCWAIPVVLLFRLIALIACLWPALSQIWQPVP